MEVNRLFQKIRALSMLNHRHADRTNVYISIYPRKAGGGSNTFSYNFKKWAAGNKGIYHLVYNISKADRAIIIADKADIEAVKKAKKNGCFIVHRLDEHVEPDEDLYRRGKHAYIKRLNALADVTVYQSNFVFENMHPFLNHPSRYVIILNGAEPEDFYPAEKSGDCIGHITWGVGSKKRLDILYETIRQNPGEKFLLAGNHKDSEFNFASLPNVTYIGQVPRKNMLSCLHRMKFLYFPSENDPCPNTVIEAILAGIPVCYNPLGGTRELINKCGLPLSEFRTMLKEYASFRQNCLARSDLFFGSVAQKYMELG